MSKTNLKPKWWQLYLTLPLLIVLFVVDTRIKLSMRGHEVVQVGIIVLIYGLVHFWVKANGMALTGMHTLEEYGRVIVIQISPYDESENKQFQLPTSEIHSVLSDTFDMGVIDAEFLPVDEAQKKLG